MQFVLNNVWGWCLLKENQLLVTNWSVSFFMRIASFHLTCDHGERKTETDVQEKVASTEYILLLCSEARALQNFRTTWELL